MVREIADPFFAPGGRGRSTRARERNYNVVLGSAHRAADEAIELYAALKTRHCDAIILLGDIRDQPRLLDDLAASHVPMVTLWQGDAVKGVHALNVDNRGGVHAAVDHLAGLGHRRFGFVGKSRLIDVREQVATFVERLTSSACRHATSTCWTRRTIRTRGRTRSTASPRTREPPTAVITATDHVAHWRTPRGPSPRHLRAGAGVGRRLRRHPPVVLHRAPAHHPAQPGRRDGQPRRRPRPRPPRRGRHRPRARPGARGARVDRPSRRPGPDRAPVLLSR